VFICGSIFGLELVRWDSGRLCQWILEPQMNADERRWRGTGQGDRQIEGRVFVVVYTDRSRVRRIISAWKASGKDFGLWQNRE
jgi:uncharacterized DUF497 family protein